MTARPPVRLPRVPSPGSPPDIYNDELAPSWIYLDRLRVHHLGLVTRFLSVADGDLYVIDLVFGAAMTRSYALVDGFLSAIESWNPIVAAPILRMQIDSLVRMSYMARAPRADDVAAYVAGGGEFRKLKDAEGKTLTDRRLIELATPAHPWLQDVYDATSGWVHFSPQHVRAAWRVDERDVATAKGTAPPLLLSGAIPLQPEQIPLSALRELLGAMIKATEELFGYSEAWESRKGLPPGEERELGM